MPNDRERLHRRSIRLRGYDYGTAGMYFVTICVQDRQCRLGRIIDGVVALSRFGEIVDRCWHAIPDHFPNAALDAYVVMPNHIHGIIVIGRPGEPDDSAAGAGDVPAFQAHPPSAVGAQHAAPLPRTAMNTSAPRRVTPGSLGAIVRSFEAAVTREINATCDTPGTPFWQRNYWEHVIRNAAEYEHIYTYILSNPALWTEDGLYRPDSEGSIP